MIITKEVEVDLDCAELWDAMDDEEREQIFTWYLEYYPEAIEIIKEDNKILDKLNEKEEEVKK